MKFKGAFQGGGVESKGSAVDVSGGDGGLGKGFSVLGSGNNEDEIRRMADFVEEGRGYRTEGFHIKEGSELVIIFKIYYETRILH